jgi:hypothetical protein
MNTMSNGMHHVYDIMFMLFGFVWILGCEINLHLLIII